MPESDSILIEKKKYMLRHKSVEHPSRAIVIELLDLDHFLVFSQVWSPHPSDISSLSKFLDDLPGVSYSDS